MSQEDLHLMTQLLPLELLNTLYMSSVAVFLAVLFGLPMGVYLVVSSKGHLLPSSLCNRLLGIFVNCGRSFPFAILMVALIPLTRFVVGTSLGTTASIVPLTVAAIPFVARIVENALREVDSKLVETAVAMGATPFQIIRTVLLPEALPSLVQGVTLTFVNVIGYSAMAGLVGGGGLGKVAIQYGYQRFHPAIMVVTVAVLILLVQGIQAIGNAVTTNLLARRGKDV